MKEFSFRKRSKQAPEETTLEDEVRAACREWQLAEQIFREVQPEFIDSAILHWKSMEERYRVLLRRILSERTANEV
ncbi:MAG: hypothetical protein GX182_02355 [Firmicutes bacterium]|jgi:hypothetical protein|nr:hypothetical protein [Bacillota bacterium]